MTRIRYMAIMLLFLAGTAVLLAEAGSRYQVSGIVVDSRSHTPIPNMKVSLAATTVYGQKLEQITGKDGRFLFVASPAGEYHLEVSKPGYPMQAYLQAGFAPLSSAIVVGDGHDNSQLVFQASREGVISGQIQDTSFDPVPDALVAILQSVVVNGERKIVSRGQMRTDVTGEFRFANLHPGNYYVCAMGRPWFADAVVVQERVQSMVNQMRQEISAKADTTRTGPPAASFSPDQNVEGTAFVTTFYPTAQTLSGASLVPLEAGGESQLTITLQPTRANSLKVKLSLPGGARDVLVKLVKEIGGEDLLIATGYQVSKEGVFEFFNIPQGSYELVASSHANPGSTNWSLRKDIEIGASDEILSVQPPPESSVAGHLLFQDDRPKSLAGARLFFSDTKGNVSQAQVGPDGSFSIHGLLAGKYAVTSNLTGYVPAYFADPAGNLLPLPIEIGASVRRNLMLIQASVGIQGVVTKAGVPQIGLFVLLIPQDPTQKWAFRLNQTNTDGSFHLSSIPAGDYFIVALTRGEDIAYGDAEVAAMLKKAAIPIHVGKSNIVNVQLKPIETVNLYLPQT